MNTYFTFNQRHEFPTTSGIYVIKNILNNKVIVGQTILPFRQRWKVHIRSLRNNNHENPHLQNAFGKYGERAFVFQILEETANELNEKEIAWIEKLNSKNRDIGYNIRDGGNHGKMSMESRRKLSLSNKGRKHTEKTKLKISKSHMGIQTCLGHKLTSAHKKKISESRRGKKNSVEVRMKLSNNAKERYKNKENHPMFGKHHSEETKQKLRAAAAKEYKLVNPFGELVIIRNLTEFCLKNNLRKDSMFKLLAGRCKSNYGWTHPNNKS